MSLNRHMQRQHPRTWLAGLKFQCAVCHVNLKSAARLQRHLIKVHQQDVREDAADE